MKVTVTKPAKTKSWNPRDRYFWSVYAGASVYFFLGAFTAAMGAFTIPWWVAMVAGTIIYLVTVHLMERWVFGPHDG